MTSARCAATAKVVGTLAKSTEVMKLVNSLLKVPEIHATMQDMSKEMLKVGSVCSALVAATARSPGPGAASQHAHAEQQDQGTVLRALRDRSEVTHGRRADFAMLCDCVPVCVQAGLIEEMVSEGIDGALETDGLEEETEEEIDKVLEELALETTAALPAAVRQQKKAEEQALDEELSKVRARDLCLVLRDAFACCRAQCEGAAIRPQGVGPDGCHRLRNGAVQFLLVDHCGPSFAMRFHKSATPLQGQSPALLVLRPPWMHHSGSFRDCRVHCCALQIPGLALSAEDEAELATLKAGKY